MKPFLPLFAALALAAGAAQADDPASGNADADMPTVPVSAATPVEVSAGQVMSGRDLIDAGMAADTTIVVSDFTAPGEPNTYTR